MADLFAKFAGPLPEALFLVRADGGIAAASPKALEVVGTQNIDGRSLCEFFAEPDETVKGFLRTCARSKALLPGALTLRGGGEQRAFRAEGAVVVPASPDQPALILLRLVPKQVSIARFHLLNAQIEAQAREIRRRKQSESALADQRRWLEVTLSSIGDAVIATDAAGRVSFVNPVAETLTGWRQSDARGKDLATVFRIVHEETGDRVENPVVKVLRDGHIVGLANHTVLIANDGAERPIDDSAAPIRGADGAIHGAVLVFRDITARKRAERERQQLLEAERSARRAAERASLMKDEFLATISHELRTPLSAILGWSQVLRLAPASGSDLQQGLEVIERNARAQKQIIEDLLDMSRIISGKIRLDVQQVDLVAVIENALETVRPSAEARDIRLQPALDPKAGPVSGDPSRLQQVFWNLLSNAIKFTPKGGRVQILLERVNSHLEVSVIDTGVGINPEFLPRLFERFSQADASTTRLHGGLGIGLAIVKQLVELHGGTVRAKSAGEGHGATFVVTLPLTVAHPTPEQRRHPQASGVEPSGDCSPRLEGVSVLVVDDEPDARELVSRVLRLCGADVRTAGSATEARAMIKSVRPTVLVSDIGMPGEDGYALIRQIRKGDAGIGHDIPAIALTAYARSEDRQRAILSGFQMHIAKPVEPAELIAMVASLAGRVPQGE